MNKKQLYIVITILLVLYGFYVIYSAYNKPHKVISKQTPDFYLLADDLMNDFSKDEELATSKYQDKVIQIEGRLKRYIPSNEGPSIIVLYGASAIINCEMSVESTQILNQNSEGDILLVKGLFIGYDDLLGELQMKKCTLQQEGLNP